MTRDSVRFFHDNQHKLQHIVTAEVRFPGFSDPFDPYLMVLHDAAGNQMRLSGCTAGYVGEGPRAAMQVLVEAGFDAEQARQVFTAPTLRLTREIPPAHAAQNGDIPARSRRTDAASLRPVPERRPLDRP